MPKQLNRISPYFSDEQIREIDKLIGKLGCSRADVVKNIVMFSLFGSKLKRASEIK